MNIFKRKKKIVSEAIDNLLDSDILEVAEAAKELKERRKERLEKEQEGPCDDSE